MNKTQTNRLLGYPEGTRLLIINADDFGMCHSVNEAGHFYNFEHMPEFLARVELDELEMEFGAQIETVLKAGLHPTHLDWHSPRITNRADILKVMFKLAQEYGLALRVAGRSSIEYVQNHGLPYNDHNFLDSYGLDPVGKSARYKQLLWELPAGLNEWALHPALDTPEPLAIEPEGNHIRQTDFDFLMSQEAQDTVKEEGIILLDYRTLQKVWKGN